MATSFKRGRIARIVALVCGLLAWTQSPALAGECKEAVRQQLEARPKAMADFNAMKFIPRRGPFGDVLGYDAWVRFNSCDGNLVVELNPWCQFRQAYWRGDCAQSLGADEKS